MGQTCSPYRSLEWQWKGWTSEAVATWEAGRTVKRCSHGVSGKWKDPSGVTEGKVPIFRLYGGEDWQVGVVGDMKENN